MPSDTADQKRAIKQALEDLEINPRNFQPAAMLGAISNAKNDLLDAEGFSKQASDFYNRTVAKVYRKYEQILTRNAALDFDDLLLRTVQLLQRHRDVLEELRERFQYVLIDEYQDTNHAQFMIANALAAEHTNIMATGDPDQSIYAWRGADVRNILEFERHFAGVEQLAVVGILACPGGADEVPAFVFLEKVGLILVQVVREPFVTTLDVQQVAVERVAPLPVDSELVERLVVRHAVAVTLGIGQRAVHVEDDRLQGGLGLTHRCVRRCQYSSSSGCAGAGRSAWGQALPNGHGRASAA